MGSEGSCLVEQSTETETYTTEQVELITIIVDVTSLPKNYVSQMAFVMLA